jgi:hypothetical protein
MSRFRRVLIEKDNNWIEVEFKELQIGNKFKMFEPTGEPVIGLKDNTEWIVMTEPVELGDGNWQVDIED